MRRKKLGDFRKLFPWGVLLVLSAVVFFITSRSTQKIEAIVEARFHNAFKISQVKVQKSVFNLSDFTWHVELTSALTTAQLLPVDLTTLTIQARRTLWGALIVDQAILQIRGRGENSGIYGGIAFAQVNSKWKLDLTNLNVNTFSIRKPIGIPAALEFSSNEKKSTGVLTFDKTKLQISLQASEGSSWVLQFPKQTVTTQKSKLPLAFLADLSTTGQWTLSARTEINARGMSGAATLQTDKSLVNVSGVGGEIFQNQRGLAFLTADLQASELGLTGKLKADFTQAALDMNGRRYFKAEGSPMVIEAKLENETTVGKISLGKGEQGARADFQVQNKKPGEKKLHVSFTKLPMELIPRAKGPVNFKQGTVNGNLVGTLVEDSMGSLKLTSWQVKGSDLNARWEQPELFGFRKIQGDPQVAGRLSLTAENEELQGYSFSGEVDFSETSFIIPELLQKNKGEPFKVKLAAVKDTGVWKKFEGEASGPGQFLKFSLKGKKLKVDFPQVLKTVQGSLQGTATFDFCGQGLCSFQSEDYSLGLSDWRYVYSPGSEAVLAGKFVLGSKGREFSNARVQFSPDAWMKVDGNISERGDAKLRISGGVNQVQAQTMDPGFLLKRMGIERGSLEGSVDFTNPESGQSGSHKLSFNGDYLERKFKVKSWEMSEGSWRTKGQAEISFEDYLLRNGKIALSSTGQVTAQLNLKDDFGMNGNVLGDLTLASEGFNLHDWQTNLRARLNGSVEIKNSLLGKVFGQAVKTYAGESRNIFARSLRECFPQDLMGKVDVQIAGSQVVLAPSLFQSLTNGSMVKFQGDLSDIKKLSLQASYLPSPECSAPLSACLGDAFPKGGVPMKVAGTFRDPEVDLDFKLIDSALEKCVANDENRGLAATPTIKKSEQAKRVRSLRDFYRAQSTAP